LCGHRISFSRAVDFRAYRQPSSLSVRHRCPVGALLQFRSDPTLSGSSLAPAPVNQSDGFSCIQMDQMDSDRSNRSGKSIATIRRYDTNQCHANAQH
jgi:hypothetical protein